MDYRRNLPSVPQWLEDHIYDIIKKSDELTINYEDEFLERMENEAENWIGRGDKELEIIAEIAKLEYNEEDTLGLHFSNPESYKSYNTELARFDFIPVDDIVNQWVFENIQPAIDEKVVGVNLQVMHHGTIITPHIDELRHRALNYQFETGGDHVTTSYYEVLPEYQHLKVYPRTLIPYNRLKKIAETTIPERTWVCLDVMSTIHSVDGMDATKRRIALSVSVINE
jgi:hypothetical protein